jgi:hypothetical protein
MKVDLITSLSSSTNLVFASIQIIKAIYQFTSLGEKFLHPTRPIRICVNTEQTKSFIELKIFFKSSGRLRQALRTFYKFPETNSTPQTYLRI